MARSDADPTRKLVSLGTIAMLLGLSAWLRPLQPAEWLPSFGINAVSVATPAVRPVSPGGFAASATTDVPAALTPEAPRRDANITAVAAAPAGDPVADAFATAGRQTGNVFQTGVAKTGGAFRTAGRAIRSIF